MLTRRNSNKNQTINKNPVERKGSPLPSSSSAVPGAATRSRSGEHYLFPRQAGSFKPPKPWVSSGSPFLLIPIKGRLSVTANHSSFLKLIPSKRRMQTLRPLPSYSCRICSMSVGKERRKKGMLYLGGTPKKALKQLCTPQGAPFSAL